MIDLPPSPKREELSPELRARLRRDGRTLVRGRQEGPSTGPRAALRRLEELLRGYPEGDREPALSLLLRDLLDLSLEDPRFDLPLDESLDHFAFVHEWSVRTIYGAYRDHAQSAYRSALRDGGDPRPWSHLPTIPEGYEDFGGAVFEDLLNLGLELRVGPGMKADLMFEAWGGKVPLRHRRYMVAFCRAFRLPLPGETIKQYRLKDVVGVGGMGVVYAASHQDLHVQVALKLLRPDCAQREQFVIEGKRTVHLGNLGDPRIVVVTDGAFEPGLRLPFFVMRYVEGGKSLAHLMERKPPVTRKGLADILRQVAGAVHLINERGYVHCDLKPGNVLISRTGPLVSDLGLCRRLRNPQQVTDAEPFSGTPAYASPEQAAGRPMTVRSDVYQLGAILYRGLTGRAPFARRSDDEPDEVTLGRVQDEVPARPRSLRPTVDPELEAVCLKCLQKSPEGRYPTVADLGADLNRYLEGEPVHARPGFRRRTLVRRCCRSAWTKVTVACLLLGALGGWARREMFLDLQQVDGCLASSNRYHISAPVRPPSRMELRPTRDPSWKSGPSASGADERWPPPDYSGFTILRSSLYFDLSDWKPIPSGETPATAGRVEPAYITHVVDLIRKENVSRSNGAIGFQQRTEGFALELRCLGRRSTVRGSAGRERLGGGTGPVLVREIEIDLSDVPLGRECRVVVNDTSWNGFQYVKAGKQWAAFLALDHLSEGELAVRFPKGRKPATPPRLYFFPKGAPEKKSPGDTQSFNNPLDQDWWEWRPRDVLKGYVYEIEWDWGPARAL